MGKDSLHVVSTPHAIKDLRALQAAAATSESGFFAYTCTVQQTDWTAVNCRSVGQPLAKVRNMASHNLVHLEEAKSTKTPTY